MTRPPEKPGDPLFSTKAYSRMLYSGVVMTIFTMTLYWFIITRLGASLEYARTMAFTFLAVASLLSVWSFRSLRDSIWRRGIRGNRWIWVSTGASVLLQLAAIYWPMMQEFFGTVPLMTNDWLLIFIMGVASLAIIDARKWMPHLGTVSPRNAD